MAASVAACAGNAAGAASSGGKTVPNPDPLARVSATELFERGEQLAALGDALRAEQYLSAAIARGFPTERALPLLLRVCVATSRLGTALQYAEPYLKLHPDDYHLRYLVAAVKLGLGHPLEAERELGVVLSHAPDYADAHYLMGVVQRDQRHDLATAAHHFAEHQRLNPSGLHGAEVAAWLREHAPRDVVAKPDDATAAGAPSTTDSSAAEKRAEPPPPWAAPSPALPSGTLPSGTLKESAQ